MCRPPLRRLRSIGVCCLAICRWLFGRCASVQSFFAAAAAAGVHFVVFHCRAVTAMHGKIGSIARASIIFGWKILLKSRHEKAHETEPRFIGSHGCVLLLLLQLWLAVLLAVCFLL